jgi:hypothetical protein
MGVASAGLAPRVAMTNEERFIGSCSSVGEAEVRARLSAGRYSAGKAVWAAAWLDQVEGAKSDATKAEERPSRLPQTAPVRIFRLQPWLLLLAVLLLVGAFLIAQFR